MTHVLAIARREIEERAFVFVAALAIALVSLVALVVPHGTFADRRGGVVILGSFLGVAFTWALALILGATLAGRELSERRMSFYFTRPVSGAAIWFGKLLAAIVLLAVSFAIVHAIPLGFGADEWRTMSSVTRRTSVLFILGAAVVLMLLSHLISTWVRSRSAILALDFVAFLLTIGFVIATLEPLALALALQPLGNAGGIFLTAIVVAAVGGGVWQLSRGRIDIRRNHRELSMFVWTIIFAAALGTFVYSRWVLAASPKDFTTVAGAQRGNLVEVRGTARRFYPEFIMNAATGAFVPAGRLYAASGEVVAVITPSETFENAKLAFERSFQRPSDWTLTITRLATHAPERIAVLPLSGRIEAIGVSRDGSRAAVIADQILTVYDTRSRHALASARVGWLSSASQAQFLAPDKLRVFLASEGPPVLNVRDFDVRTRQWTNVTGPIRTLSPFLYRVAGDMLMTRVGGAVEVHDLRNPSVVQTVPVAHDDGLWIMRDGRQVFYHYGRGAYLEIRRNGVREHVVQFGRDIESVRVAAEISGNRLLVTAHTRSRNEQFDTTAYILNADTGVLGRAMPHVYPAGSWPGSIGLADPEETQHALLHRGTGKIDVLDLQSGIVRSLSAE